MSKKKRAQSKSRDSASHGDVKRREKRLYRFSCTDVLLKEEEKREGKRTKKVSKVTT